ncbi:hypothetical protein K435DRAFT_868275 [Dendrothele bispora CBS 962.96]|uniref:Uncharacterized protein n=1 Tax=Dendrothele bispora (strain CBS 962.96) TaxID=1314807 RepID=A0A4S8LCM6_DENBC|nr:hypothetical protein K435DRAFT_868275 [Dendrothele bispora CBS 962.96]
MYSRLILIVSFFTFFTAALAAPTDTENGTQPPVNPASLSVNFTQVYSEKECVSACQPVSQANNGSDPTPSVRELSVLRYRLSTDPDQALRTCFVTMSSNCQQSMVQNIQKCVQCGNDFVANLSDVSVNGFLKNFTDGCNADPIKANVQNVQITTNDAGLTFKLSGVLVMSGISMSLGTMLSVL